MDTALEAQERPHAERSASQLKALAICPGYKPNRGTRRAHWVTEQGLRGHDALERDDKGNLESKTEEELVQACEDYVARLPVAVVDLREQKIATIEGRWGYVDRLRLRGDEKDGASDTTATDADLVDYKFVRKREPDDAEINLQGKDYAVGVLERLTQILRVHVHFLAPRFGMVTTATFTRDQLPQLKLEVLSILAQARKTDRARASSKLFRPDYDTCRFCGRLATCPAVGAIAKEVAEKYTRIEIPIVPADVHSSNAMENPGTLGALKTIAGVLRSWCDSVDAHAIEAFKNDGILAEGYDIAYRKGQRKVIDPHALVSVAHKYGLSIDDLLSTAKLSLPEVEDLVKAHAPRGDKAAARTRFLNDLRDADAIERLEETPFLQKKA